MDSTAAITKRIAASNIRPEVKKVLVALFNHELKETGPKGAPKSVYLKELESQVHNWSSAILSEKEAK